MTKKASQNIIKQLKVVFAASVVLLLTSLIASLYSTRQLIKNSELVNHTHEVLLEAENIMSHLKDAETGQRGYLITMNPSFLEPYEGSYSRVTKAYNNLVRLTLDNKLQQKTLVPMKERYEARYAQMQRVIDIAKKDPALTKNTELRSREMLFGKKIMDDLRLMINEVKDEENRMLQSRLSEQQTYIVYTPFFMIVAAVISILITIVSFLRIKQDIDKRIEKEREAEELYTQTKNRINLMEGVTRQIASGNYNIRSKDTLDDELGRISSALNTMAGELEKTFTDLEKRNWLQTGTLHVSEAMRGERILERLSANLMNSLTSYLNAPLGTLYIIDNDYHYKLTAAYANSDAPRYVYAGNGLAGQAIESKQLLIVNNLPENYVHITSTLGTTHPRTVMIIPLIYAHECIGVIEIGLLNEPSELEIQFIKDNQEAIAIGLNAALDYSRLQNFLEETQAQAEELQAQHNELENLNSELEAQSQKLQASDEELRVQQEELQQTNEELEERSTLLEEKNMEIQSKARELEITTRYKSEFLANMSHELRTPLNSILLLSRLLAENDEKNLSADQIEYASVINSSGNGLLGLIDEILDLSKIEAGKMELEYTNVDLKEVSRGLQAMFSPVAREKGIELNFHLEPSVKSVVETDKMRLEQVIKNLLSNALKFTSKGSVTMDIRNSPTRPDFIEFVVKDTGIGIAPEKQMLIFEAFQQADGSTKRKYGGTGLGLSISRELVKLLGGEIHLKSEINQGSEFTLFLPVRKSVSHHHPVQNFMTNYTDISENTGTEDALKYISSVVPESIPDDRNAILETDKTILIVEDDTFFAKSLLDYTRKKGYKGIVAVRGDEGLQLAEEFKPIGILLDLQLPILSGWEVMDRLKENPATRHIPVHIMSSHRMKNESLLKGAVDFIDKPVAPDRMKEIFEKIEYVISRKSKKVLIVEDNSKHASALAYFLGTFNINSELKDNISDGLQALRENEVDCVILDMGVPDQQAYQMLEEVKKTPDFEHIPIIIFTGKSLSINEEYRIKQYADSIILKTAHSYQRMLDEVSLFLHVVEENKKPASTKGDYRKLGALGDILNNKTVLVADDDVRNIFSLTKSLENYKMNVITALDGKEALEKLKQTPEIDVVLLDMMMPQMDGYETARQIRANPVWKTLPVIAVTAKAMTGDREKCINAGASDYITKPVDIDQLVSLLRVWLYEK
ncbi:Sensor histidine kinase RcsC [Dyadobacter sp. CECT 9275]|uniref:histidine kinase n=1 Tax=Dyadobacter helix TaxID=2822344 RepID=A0A916JIM9_9BACT|nr:response regulator [Dyadobacter sp. CECT 9275]CAG5016630.1 Sensor histidine kinase RcsC [Dyadobacter sp. CECT 9275]